jgi:heme exporter protein CcmD
VEHGFFIITAYAVSALALLVLTLAVIISAKAARARVETLEKGASDRMPAAPLGKSAS